MDKNKILLDLMLKDMESANILYRPTNFWSSGLQTIVHDLKTLGFSNFREHPSAAFYYVPTYGGKYWKRYKTPLSNLFRLLDKISSKKIGVFIQNILDGTNCATNDYRVLVAGNPIDDMDLSAISESPIGGGERFYFGENIYSKSFLNYCRGLTLLKNTTKPPMSISVLEIGGGYGTLGEILLKTNPDAFYINIDIPPVAAVSSYYLTELFGEDNVLTYEKARTLTSIDLNTLKQEYKCAVLCPWQLPKIHGQVDLFANFMSFQEMEPDVVNNYIKLIQPLTSRHVLLRNSRHGKKIAPKAGSVGVFEKTSTDSMINQFDQFDLQTKESLVYGEVNHKNDFFSEVIIMTHK